MTIAKVTTVTQIVVIVMVDLTKMMITMMVKAMYMKVAETTIMVQVTVVPQQRC